MSTLSGEATAMFIFASILNINELPLQEKNLLL